MKTKKTRWYEKALSIAANRKHWDRTDLMREISRKLESSESAAYAWLNGTREPQLEVIRRIAKECLEVSISELVEDDPYFSMDEKERELIEAYRKLEQTQQDLHRQLIVSQTKTKKSE
jgi:transcriptional regulator with XRE-family HTH domain